MPDGQSLVTHEHDGFVFTSANATEEELAQTVGADAPPDEGSPDAPAPEPQQEPAAATAPESAAPVPPVPVTKGPEGRKAQLQAEINALTRSKHQTRAEAEQTQQELAQLRWERQQLQAEIDAAKAAKAPPAPEAKPETPPADDAPKEPSLDDFDDVAQWVTAHSKWTREQATRDVLAAQQTKQTTEQQQYLQQQQAAQQQYMQQKWAEHEQRFTAYVQAHPEAVPIFQAAAQLPMSKQHDMLMTHVLHSDKGPEILRFLAEHPTECERISTLPAGPTLIELGRIEERLSAVKSGAAQKPRPVSRTSPPITPVGGGADVADDASDLSTLPFGPEYVRRMNALENRRA